MSIHKLTAGSGYDYLTRQVAALDATDKGHTGLASYYTERGETPGVWVGSGMAGIDGLDTGDVVTAEQMQALFGAGHHPLAQERLTRALATAAAARARHGQLDLPLDARSGPDGADPRNPATAGAVRGAAAAAQLAADGALGEDAVRAAVRLGAPYKVYAGDVSPFRVKVARRLAARNEADGLPGDWPVPPADRSRVRTEVAREFFAREHGRDPADARELAATIAKHSRPATTAVAGYDLTFSPVKSVSTLWAIAPPPVAAAIERAHQAAVGDALRFLETHALYTRTGTNGVRQVDVQGLVAAAFTHRDSRAGDPDLHTHVALANKVQTLDGRWLSIDGRVLFKATVTASETYNSALERRLHDALGLQFDYRAEPARPAHTPAGKRADRGDSLAAPRDGRDRPGRPGDGHGRPDRPSDRRASEPGPRADGGGTPQRLGGQDRQKRPVREVVGVDPALNVRWSSRRAVIEVRRAELATQFQATHGRPPTPVESIQLAQQATLETRDAKKDPRTLAEQRATWRAQAADELGGERHVDAMVARALRPARRAQVTANPGWVAGVADTVLATVEEQRATWQVWHVRAEAHRQIRAANLPTRDIERVVDDVVARVLHDRSVSLARTATTTLTSALGDTIRDPESLRRTDGSSVYSVAGADLYTSTRVLTAEQRIVALAGRRDGHQVAGAAVDVTLLESTANGVTLNAGQVALVRQMATSGARVQLAVAPAGSGKTTAMRALTAAWTEGGGTVIGLAPSAAAAAALREQISTPRARPAVAAVGAREVVTDTLAKLTWHLSHDPSPDPSPRSSRRTSRHGHRGRGGREQRSQMPRWIADIGPRTLVVIDEAGMADTLSLAAAVDYVVDRGGSVRLIGDDQQLAAIGAGGVLRDITATHGALQLSELLRFVDPAEGAASLALREGRGEALGFYLDVGRVHVGDLATMTEDVFAAWQVDRANDLDSIMLAPTRDLVAELNRRARAHRLATEQDTPPASDQGKPEIPGQAGAVEAHEAAASSGGSGSPAPGRVSRTVGRGVGRTVVLADGNEASAGDLVITRANERKLRLTATDWVKNGDRWTILAVTADGSLTARHLASRRVLTLPPGYVAGATELGYATTVHTAQGVSVDTMHGLATGQESRQQLYTMLTRGRLANHVYLEVVGDGDSHRVIRPDVVHPRTATDLLEGVLARDDSPRSASTQLRNARAPATLLGAAAARYVDALYVAAEDLARSDLDAQIERGSSEPGASASASDPVGDTGRSSVAAALDARAEDVVPAVTDQAAWPALRAHLLLLAAAVDDPIARLRAAAATSELTSAADAAAVLDWRLDDTGLRDAGPGPLPWVPAIPASIRAHPTWGPYLTARADLVTQLTAQVHQDATAAANAGRAPEWTQATGAVPAVDVLADVAVWRAAIGVDVDDRRPTGAPQLQKAAARWQQQLDERIAGARTPALAEWGPLLTAASPGVATDPFTPLLAERLAALSRAAVPAHSLLREAMAAGALPDDHPAAALWWRISRHLSPAVATHVDREHALTTSWAQELPDLVGADRAARLEASPWWPALVATVDHGLQRGWQLGDLLTFPASLTGGDHDGNHDGVDDECQAAVWRASVLMDPVPPHPDDDLPTGASAHLFGPGRAGATHGHDLEENEPPEDLWDGVDPIDDAHVLDVDDPTEPSGGTDRSFGATGGQAAPDTDVDTDVDLVGADLDVDQVEVGLELAAQLRDLQEPLRPSDAALDRAQARAADADFSPVSPARILEINERALRFFEAQLPGAWGQQHLIDRFGLDLGAALMGHPDVRPGQAPAAWNALVTHLRRGGVSDEEMLAAGVATTASTGRLIDRFRDRLVIPIRHDGDVLGFIGRRHPDRGNDDRAGPKYLNTPDTVVFHKGAQLFTVGDAHKDPAVTPVVVEGPMDVLAVTLGTEGPSGSEGSRFVGVAPLGTSLTEEQAAELARSSAGGSPVVATDSDTAGHVAAERAYWLLTAHGLDPTRAELPDGEDPASVLGDDGPDALRAALTGGRDLADVLIDERLAHLPPDAARTASAAVLAARPPQEWQAGAQRIASRLQVPVGEVRADLLTAVREWNRDPGRASQVGVQDSAAVRDRLTGRAAHDDHAAASRQPPARRWAPLADRLDRRLTIAPDWAALAEVLQHAHDRGHDVPAVARQLVAEAPLGLRPARDLRYRIVGRLDLTLPTPSVASSGSGQATQDRRAGDPRDEPRDAPRGRLSTGQTGLPDSERRGLPAPAAPPASSPTPVGGPRR